MALNITVTNSAKAHVAELKRETEVLTVTFAPNADGSPSSIRMYKNPLGDWKPDFDFNVVNPAVYADGSTKSLDPVGWGSLTDAAPRTILDSPRTDENDVPLFVMDKQTGKPKKDAKGQPIPSMTDGANAIGRQVGERTMAHIVAYGTDTAPVAGQSGIQATLEAYRATLIEGMRDAAEDAGVEFSETNAKTAERINTRVAAKRTELVDAAKARAAKRTNGAS